MLFRQTLPSTTMGSKPADFQYRAQRIFGIATTDDNWVFGARPLRTTAEHGTKPMGCAYGRWIYHKLALSTYVLAACSEIEGRIRNEKTEAGTARETNCDLSATRRFNIISRFSPDYKRCFNQTRIPLSFLLGCEEGRFLAKELFMIVMAV